MRLSGVRFPPALEAGYLPESCRVQRVASAWAAGRELLPQRGWSGEAVSDPERGPPSGRTESPVKRRTRV